jgi:hypothetical protein
MNHAGVPFVEAAEGDPVPIPRRRDQRRVVVVSIGHHQQESGLHANTLWSHETAIAGKPLTLFALTRLCGAGGNMTATRFVKGCAAVLMTIALPGVAVAGTPLICHANDIGQAASLPWGAGPDWNQPRSDYAADRLVADTLALLTAKTPVIVRMETMRRATIYARVHADRGRPELGPVLLERLQARALDAEASGIVDPLAWFDAGYFAGSLEQWSETRVRGQHAGYSWVLKAIRARGGDAQMEMAAALMSLESPGKTDGHWARAAAGGKADPLLARNLAARRGH